MLEKLSTAISRRADAAVKRNIDRLAQAPTPPGISVNLFDGGIVLTGKRLRRRMLNDPQLRNFGR